MRRLIYYFKTALENIQINRVMVFFSLFSLSLTLMLFGFFLLFYHNVQRILVSMQEDVQLSIYLSDSAQEEAVRSIKAELSEEKGVLSFRYISKEEALNLFKREFQDMALIKNLEGNPLPASFEVKVTGTYQEPRKLAEMVDRFRALPGVEEVQYGSEWIQSLHALLKLLKMIGVGIGGLLSVTVIAIIANTVRLHMYNRKEEIDIMKLLGATDSFIKTPFFLEGALIGILSGCGSVLMLSALFYLSKTSVQSVGGMVGGILELHFLPIPLSLGMIVAAGVLGGIGSVISSTRLLKIRGYVGKR